MTALALTPTPAPIRGASQRREQRVRRRARWGLQIAMIASVADVSAVEVGGINIRIAWLLLPIAALLIRRGPRDNFWAALTAALVVLHLVAGLAADSLGRGLAYVGWIMFSFLLLFRAGANASRVLGMEAWDVVILNGRIQIITSLLMVAAGLHDRAQFLYYEPSYMGIGLIPYVFTSIHLSKRRWLDFTLIAMVLMANQSANQALILGIAVMIWVFQEGLTIRTVAVLLSIPLLGVALVLLALSDPLNANYNIVKYLFDYGISWELVKVGLERGGNRVPRIQAAIEIAREVPWLGIGPGNYVDVTASRDWTHIHGGLWWTDPAGLPAVNVLIEAATNVGILGSIVLITAFGTLFVKAMRHRNVAVRRAILGALIAAAVTMQFESSYLRAYLWIFFGVSVGQLWTPPRRRRVLSTPSGASAADVAWSVDSTRPDAKPLPAS